MFEMVEIEQKFVAGKIEDLKQNIDRELRQYLPVDTLPPKAQIAVTAGSRGIANIAEILRIVVARLKEMGLAPFLVPAMGSHGGATAEGQVEVLRHLGITETSVGAQIRSSMEVEQIAVTPKGVPVYMDKNAYHADGIIVVNRVKAHTAFRGSVESGLSKMVTIGLGKIKGATYVHRHGALRMAENIEEVCATALHHAPILMGLAILENGYDETADIVGIHPRDWFEKESELLRQSKEMMPSLPIENIDLLIVEEMGKIYSGTGMDPNIIGRWRIEGVPEPESPQIKRIAVLDLAEQSFGNAQGVGLADFTTQQLVDRMDPKATYTNALTSTYLQRAMLPLIYPTEKEAIETALRSLGPQTDHQSVKAIQIPNTLHLHRLYVSPPVLQEMEQSAREFQVHGRHVLSFDENGVIAKKLTAGED